MAKISDFISKWWQSLFIGNDEIILTRQYRIGQKGAVWLDTAKPYTLYNSIPQLRKVIDRKSAMFANMELKLINKSNGDAINDNDFEKLIKNPNPLQSMNSWLRNYKSQEQIYGNQFMYKNKPSNVSKYPISLSNISPFYIKPVLTGKLFDQTEMSGIISAYEYMENGTTRTFNTGDILYSKIEDLDNPVIGTSPLMSLKFPLTNTKLAYEYRNVIMGEMGAPKIISGAGKDQVGSIPMTDVEKKEAEDAFTNDYGISKGKRKVKIISAPIQVTNNAFPTKDLMLFDEVDANEIAIVDHFGLNINIFSGKNQTYENVKNAIIQCYQDTIQVEADLFTQALGKFIGVPDNLQLIASYKHIPILKENEKKAVLSVESITRALTQATQSGILDAEQARIILQNELSTHLDEA